MSTIYEAVTDLDDGEVSAGQVEIWNDERNPHQRANRSRIAASLPDAGGAASSAIASGRAGGVSAASAASSAIAPGSGSGGTRSAPPVSASRLASAPSASAAATIGFPDARYSGA